MISLARGILLKSTDNDKDSANFAHSSDLKERYLCKQKPTEKGFLTLTWLDFYLKHNES